MMQRGAAVLVLGLASILSSSCAPPSVDVVDDVKPAPTSDRSAAPTDDDIDDIDDIDDDLGDVTLSSDRSAGVYEVPIEAELAHVASNPVRVRFRRLDGGRVRLKYDLPEVIAGFDREVDLTGRPGADGVIHLTGPSGTGTCTESPSGEVTCVEYLDGVTMSLAEAKRAIDALALSEAERAARQLVAERFIIDPLGIVRFQRRR